PQGVHVSLLIVDGVIDIPRTRKMFPERPHELFLNPDDIAATALFLTRQPRNAWTFEVDLRPSAENW
ncbi:MAG: short-chain dehydrogenase, partial [Chromatiales bacterium]|nr:short-chain dehydrogenase [Chromatiales bacterium]